MAPFSQIFHYKHYQKKHAHALAYQAEHDEPKESKNEPAQAAESNKLVLARGARPVHKSLALFRMPVFNADWRIALIL